MRPVGKKKKRRAIAPKPNRPDEAWRLQAETGACRSAIAKKLRRRKMKTETKDEKLKRLYGLLEKAEKDGDDVKWNLIAQEIAAIEG